MQERSYSSGVFWKDLLFKTFGKRRYGFLYSVSNYTDVYQRLKKVYKFRHITLNLQYIWVIILIEYPKKQKYNKDLNQSKYQHQYCNFHLVPLLDTFKKSYIFTNDRVTPNFISVIHGNLNWLWLLHTRIYGLKAATEVIVLSTL